MIWITDSQDSYKNMVGELKFDSVQFFFNYYKAMKSKAHTSRLVHDAVPAFDAPFSFLLINALSLYHHTGSAHIPLWIVLPIQSDWSSSTCAENPYSVWICRMHLLEFLKVSGIAYSPFPLSQDAHFYSVEVLMSSWHSLGWCRRRWYWSRLWCQVVNCSVEKKIPVISSNCPQKKPIQLYQQMKPNNIQCILAV